MAFTGFGNGRAVLFWLTFSFLGLTCHLMFVPLPFSVPLYTYGVCLIPATLTHCIFWAQSFTGPLGPIFSHWSGTWRTAPYNVVAVSK
ncbi:hypothetical protein NEOLEDRAFT_1128754 [Neolentinus lepideus HHB14362 ss-1]|uniref:Uncharacterized protein n=1 Tax=Neolentinus lepideus HHB14362 ss-1 TaxID=1314782 RepID=A0A165V526_9AGAM|nr:hypothetical protein NEOLEDRAFT_1128754 [Neolentinus lepideus HHB14362 ss-1]